jgi:hypothetical protein
MMLRAGLIPDHLVRPGQTLTLLVTQDAKAGEKAQVQIAGRTLEALLPGPVGVGQRIQVRVTRAASEGIQLRLIEMRDGPPVLKVPAERQAQIQSMASKNGGQVQIQTTPGGKELLVAGQPMTPSQLGLARIPAIPKWVAESRMMPGGGMQLVPVAPERAQQLRGLAGDLMLTRRADLIETGVDISQQLRDSEKTYDATGQAQVGPAWMQLPDGTPIAVGQKPMPEKDGKSWSAQFSLHGAALGAVGIRLVASAAGIHIHVQSDQEHHQFLTTHATELQERLRLITGKPVQVQIRGSVDATDSRPPEGYQYYG